LCILAIIIDHPTYIASQHRGRTKPLYDGNVKILNDGFFTNIKSRAYTVTKTDIDVWESKNGRIPNGALVILRTGWSQYFHQPDNFFGNFADEDKQVFPGKCSKIVWYKINISPFTRCFIWHKFLSSCKNNLSNSQLWCVLQ